MTLAEDKSRIAELLRQRKGTTVRFHQLWNITNKNSKADVTAALASLVTDGKVSTKEGNCYAITTTTA